MFLFPRKPGARPPFPSKMIAQLERILSTGLENNPLTNKSDNKQLLNNNTPTALKPTTAATTGQVVFLEN